MDSSPYTFEAHVNGDGSSPARKYTIEAYTVTPGSIPTFDGGAPPADGHRFQLPDGTPVEKIGELAYELPDGTVLVTSDINAP